MSQDIDLDWTKFDELRRAGKKAKARRSLSTGRRKLRPPTSRDRLHAQQRRELAARREQAKRIIRSQGLHRGQLRALPGARKAYDTPDRGGMMSGLFAGQFSTGRYTDDIELGIFSEALHPRGPDGKWIPKGSPEYKKTVAKARRAHLAGNDALAKQILAGKTPPRNIKDDHRLEAKYQLHVAKADKLIIDRLKTHSTDLTHGHHVTGPDGKDQIVWDKERAKIQRQIVQTVFRREMKHAKKEKKALFLGGLPGAGKTRSLEKLPGVNQRDYITINPDNFKEELARRGLVPNIKGLSPMEASAMVHEESSHMALMLAELATKHHANIIWDITMSSPKSVRSRLKPLREAGYKAHAVFVDIPFAQSQKNVITRHRSGWLARRRDTTGTHLGQRLVPSSHVNTGSPRQGLTSANREAFEAEKKLFDGYRRYENEKFQMHLADSGGKF